MRRLAAPIAIAIVFACGGRSDLSYPATNCATPEVECNGVCTLLTSDHDHCGSCTLTCQSSQVCSNGQCATSCASNELNCGGSCVDSQNDPHHCGDCATDCGADACVAGKCAPTCTQGMTTCSNACVDLQYDNANCGACANACSVDATCTIGTCICQDASKTFCNSLCVDLQTEPEDCGACGVVCLGTCTNGRCLQVLASSPDPGPIAVDDTNVFWSDYTPDAGAIWRVSRDGGSATTLAGSSSAEQFVLDQENVYWLHGEEGGPLRVSKDGGTPIALTTNGFSGAGGIALDDAFVYFGNVYRVPRDGGTPVEIAASNSQNLVVDAQRVYWASYFTGTINSVPIDGGTTQTLASSTGPHFVAIDATAIYWTIPTVNGSIMKTAIGGNAVVQTLASNVAYPGPVLIDGTDLYFSTLVAPTGVVAKMSIAGGPITVLADNQQGPLWIAIDTTSIYWTNGETGTVVKLTPR